MLLSSHKCIKQIHIKPTLKAILPWVEKSLDPDGHWLWETSHIDRRYDYKGQAIWSYKIVEYAPRQIFIVARLLIEHLIGPIPARISHENACGLLKCINPYHWREKDVHASHLFMRDQHGWYPVEVRSGRPEKTSVPLNVRFENVVHVVMASNVPALTVHALCGKELNLNMSAVLNRRAIVTCKNGCSLG